MTAVTPAGKLRGELDALRAELVRAESPIHKAEYPARQGEVRAEISRVQTELAALARPSEDEIAERKQARAGRRGKVERAVRAPDPRAAA